MENEISVLIVEDEEIWIQNLHLILKDLGFAVANTVSTVDDALSAFAENNYDLILMDINIDGRNSGIELGKIVSKLYKKPFIFITASHDHKIKDAAEAKPSAYLTKPINSSSLFIAIQNAINNFNNQQSTPDNIEDNNFTSFFVKNGSKYKKIDWKDVAYLSAGKNYIGIFNAADKSEYYIRSSLQKILQHQIPKQLQKQFIQLNRSEAVQFSFVQEVKHDEVKTIFKSFAVSESFSKDLKSRLNILS